MSDLMIILGVVLNGLFLAMIGLGDRSALLRPSVLFHLAFFLQVQVGLLFAHDLAASLRLDRDMLAWRYLFGPLAVFIIVYAAHFRAFRELGKTIWGGISFARQTGQPAPMSGRGNLGIVMVTFALGYGGAVIWYVSEVGWVNTPIHALITLDPSATLIREQGLKLLDNRYLAYGLTLAISYFGPGLAAILAMRHVLGWRRFPSDKWFFAVLIALALPATVAGSRASGGMIVVVGAMVYMVAQTPRRRLLVMPLLLGVTFGVPLLMFAVRLAGSSVDHVTMGMAFANMADRFFMRGLEAELWQLSYVQNFGNFGLSGIPRLARLLGETQVDIFNSVGTFFRPNSPTISANASFVTVNFALFGGVGIFVTGAELWLLDHFAQMARRVRPAMAWFLASMWILPAILLSATTYESIFISRGAVITLMIYAMLRLPDWMGRRKRNVNPLGLQQKGIEIRTKGEATGGGRRAIRPRFDGGVWANGHGNRGGGQRRSGVVHTTGGGWRGQADPLRAERICAVQSPKPAGNASCESRNPTGSRDRLRHQPDLAGAGSERPPT